MGAQQIDGMLIRDRNGRIIYVKNPSTKKPPIGHRGL